MTKLLSFYFQCDIFILLYHLCTPKQRNVRVCAQECVCVCMFESVWVLCGIWKQWGIPSNVAGPGDNSAFQLLPIYFMAAALSFYPALDEKHRWVKKLKWKSFWKQQDWGMVVLSMTQWHFHGMWSNLERKISLYGHLLSSALSQDHKLFWVTGLGTWWEECTQLPADI